MWCKVCGHDELVDVEYRTGQLSAPALECARCHALNLDEHAAKSEQDLESVRRALVARRAASTRAPPAEAPVVDGKPHLDDLYVVLRAWAVASPVQIRSYADLSQEYRARTNDWFDPHGSWDFPLGELNRRLHEALTAPALSALVVLKDTGAPGAGFWGSAPSVPVRPADPLIAWLAIVQAVRNYPWPAALP